MMTRSDGDSGWQLTNNITFSVCVKDVDVGGGNPVMATRSDRNIGCQLINIACSVCLKDVDVGRGNPVSASISKGDFHNTALSPPWNFIGTSKESVVSTTIGSQILASSAPAKA